MAKRFFSRWRKWCAGALFPGKRTYGWALARGTTLLVGAAVGALVCMGALAYYQARNWAETAALTEHTRDVLAEISAIQTRIAKISGFTRGYTLTGQTRFLDKFNANAAQLDAQLAHLRKLTQENPAQQTQIALLERQINTRLESGRRVFTIRQKEGAKNVAKYIPVGHGEALGEAAIQTLQQIKGEEQRLLKLREKASLEAGRTTFIILPAGTLVSLAILAIGVFRLNKQTSAAGTSHEQAITGLLESIHDGFFALDSHWRYVRVNTAALKILGVSRQDLLGKVLWDVFPEGKHRLFETRYRKAMKENTAVCFEEFYPAPLNAWYEVRAYPATGGLNVFFINISKRKQTEQQLRQLSRAVEQSPSIVMITDTKGFIEYVNPKFTELTGYTFDEVRGKKPGILKPPGTHFERDKELWATILAGNEWRGEFHNQKKNGELYWEYASISPIFDDQGHTTHYVAVKEDITSRKMMEASLVEAKQQAEEANKTKDVFLATLSHELRTPLTPVLLTASSAESDDALDKSIREQFRLIRKSIELESRLIDDLLDLTKITRGKFSLNFQAFNAEEPLDKTLDFLRQDYTSKNLKVEWKRTARSGLVYADKARLHQVFWNILKNAIKFTPPGGSIHIRTFNPNPESLAVEFRDTGIGIAAEFLPNVFQPFHQGAAAGKPQFGGLGLGLAITKTIVDAHGGSITVESPGVGFGTTFTVQIPLWKGSEALHETATMEPAGEKSSMRQILLVEDDKVTRTVLSSLLKKDGHAVIATGSCKTALAALNEQPQTTPFEIILCDLGLPDGSGLDIIGPIKTRFPKATAVAISGFGMAEDIRRSKEAGFRFHLVKPISIEELRQTIAKAG